MAIPTFDRLMLPLLQELAASDEGSLSQLTQKLSERFGLTPEERTARLPSGIQTVIHNRVGWAKWHLEKLGYVETVKRGVYRITEAGRRRAGLSQPDFTLAEARAFISSGSADANEAVVEASAGVVATPEERIGVAVRELELQLAEDIKARLLEMSPSGFEQLVVSLLLKMGYGGSRAEAGQAVGRSGDGGVDGVISEDRLGLDAIYIQAKRWKGTVGEPEVRNFLGALVGRGAGKGVFITTGTFSDAARAFAQRSIQQKIVLIDGDRLASLMIEHGLGVTTMAIYEVRRLDSDFFSEE